MDRFLMKVISEAVDAPWPVLVVQRRNACTAALIQP